MYTKVKLINHDCLPILMLLHLMLYIMLAYLMLFAALSNAVCLYDAFIYFLLLIFANAFCFHAFSGLLTNSFFFQVLFCSIHSAFNLLVFTNYMFTTFFI